MNRGRRTEEGTAQWAGVIWDWFPGEEGAALFFHRKFVLSWGLLGEGRRRKPRDVAFNDSTSLKVTGCLWRKAFLAMGSR